MKDRRFKPQTAFPILFVHLMAIFATWRLITAGFSWPAWIVFTVMWAVNVLGVTIAYHRYTTHGAFQCSPMMGKVLYAMAAISIQGEGIWWSENHWRHHVFTDVEGDPHRPSEFGEGLAGFLWAHVGWILFEMKPPPREYQEPARFRESKGLQWQRKYYWLLALSIGFGIPSLVAGWDGFLLAGFLRLALCWHLSWGVNSACHMIGAHAHGNSGEIFETRSARNFPWYCLFWILALLSCGEYWHANHHARQRSAYLGWRWWEVDPGGWVIAAGKRIGIFHNVELPNI